jgi:hypothetical protein
MSNNYDAGLALFADSDNLFQDLTPADESTIAGGSYGYKSKSYKSKSKSKSKGRSFFDFVNTNQVFTLKRQLRD